MRIMLGLYVLAAALALAGAPPIVAAPPAVVGAWLAAAMIWPRDEEVYEAYKEVEDEREHREALDDWEGRIRR